MNALEVPPPESQGVSYTLGMDRYPAFSFTAASNVQLPANQLLYPQLWSDFSLSAVVQPDRPEGQCCIKYFWTLSIWFVVAKWNFFFSSSIPITNCIFKQCFKYFSQLLWKSSTKYSTAVIFIGLSILHKNVFQIHKVQHANCISITKYKLLLLS